jgi:hypothetical protein
VLKRWGLRPLDPVTRRVRRDDIVRSWWRNAWTRQGAERERTTAEEKWRRLFPSSPSPLTVIVDRRKRTKVRPSAYRHPHFRT